MLRYFHLSHVDGAIYQVIRWGHIVSPAGRSAY